MKKSLLLFIVFCSFFSFSQKKKMRWSDTFVAKEKPRIPREEVEIFIDEDEYLITFEAGDFIEDKLIDAVAITAKKDEVSAYNKDQTKTKRKVLILKRNNEGKLEKIAENEDIVYCYLCESPFGSPLTSIVFSGNTFAIEHEAGKANRWARIITFEYNFEQQQWLLLKDASSIYNIMNSSGFQSDVKTRKDFGNILFTNYDAFSLDLVKKSTD